MDLDFNEEESIWQSTVNRFVEKEVGCEYVQKCDTERRFPAEAYKKIASQGWLSLVLPEEYGGAGFDPVLYVIFCEAMGKYSPDFALSVMIPMFIASAIADHGSNAQKSELLPSFLEGKTRFCFSMTEPDAGSDATNLKTRATRSGNKFVLNGQKVFVTGAHIENSIIEIVTRTNTYPGKSKREGLTCFLLPNDTPGIQLRKMEPLARRMTGTNEMFLTDVELPEDAILGSLDHGFEVVIGNLLQERISLAAAYVGCAQTVVDTAAKYAKERIQFGRPIAQFQVIRHMIVDMQTKVDAARLLTYKAACELKKGRTATIPVYQAKYFGAETLQAVATDGMQILGGYGQMPEYNMERYFREGKQANIGGGTTQIIKDSIGKKMLS